MFLQIRLKRFTYPNNVLNQDVKSIEVPEAEDPAVHDPGRKDKAISTFQIDPEKHHSVGNERNFGVM